jgi:hypothetical protein
MESTGVMQHVRELLGQGKSSRDVIEMGYAPGTVYKAQRQLRSNNTRTLSKPSTPYGKHVYFGGSVTLIDEENAFWWHIEPSILCPECRHPVVHWMVCPECSRLIPNDCKCPDNSPSMEGYTLNEVLHMAVH